MSEEKKIQKLFSKLDVDGQDLYTLATVLKSQYENEEDYDKVLDDIVKVKDDIIAVVAALKKKLK